MPPTAELVRGRTNFGADVSWQIDDPVSSTGQRDYVIKTGDEVEAWTATGLPGKGDQWSLAFPKLTCQSRKMTPVIVHPDGSGLYWCRLQYATPGTAFFTEAGVDGLKFSSIVPGSEVVMQYTDVGFDGTNGAVVEDETDDLDGVTRRRVYGETINRGRGAPRDIGTCEVEVTHWRQPETITDEVLNALVKLMLMRPQNSDLTLTLPEFRSTNGVTWTLGPGQVRYLGFTPGGDGNLARLVHRLQVKSDFWYRWNTIDARGNAIGPLRRNQIVPFAELAGIW